MSYLVTTEKDGVQRATAYPGGGSPVQCLIGSKRVDELQAGDQVKFRDPRCSWIETVVSVASL